MKSLLLLASIVVSGTALAQSKYSGLPTTDDYNVVRARLDKIGSTHPRLMLTPAKVSSLKTLIANDTTADAYYDSLVAQGEAELAKTVTSYGMQYNSLLTCARCGLRRVQLFGLLWQLTGDVRYRDRGRQEVLGALTLANWYPTHFLSTAEMTSMVAIGYDWLYDAFSADEKLKIRAALVNNALSPALESFFTREWWSYSSLNWNAVCNGGMAMGALAIADTDYNWAMHTLANVRGSIQMWLSKRPADGSSDDCAGYWRYELQYYSFLISSLQSATGDDLGIKDSAGLSNTYQYANYQTLDNAKTFNYGDAQLNNATPFAFFLSQRTQRPQLAYQRRSVLKTSTVEPMDLVWYTNAGSQADVEAMPESAYLKPSELVFLKTSWNPNALQIAMKGGRNDLAKSQLDQGTFVLDADGQRWVEDLGSDSGDILPGYYTVPTRSNYFRVSTAGQSTVRFNGLNQLENGTGTVKASNLVGNKPYAIFNLAHANANVIWNRGVYVQGNDAAMIHDQWNAVAGTPSKWSIHTRAAIAVSVDGRTAILAMNGKTMKVVIRYPLNATFEVESDKVAAPENPNTGFNRLVVNQITPATASGSLAVAFIPGSSSADVNALPFGPISTWGTLLSQ